MKDLLPFKGVSFASQLPWPSAGIVLLILFLVPVSSLQAQDTIQYTRITISKENTSLDELLEEIESNYPVYFSYTHEIIPNGHSVSIHVEDQPLESVLKKIFENTFITYTFSDPYIILTNPRHQTSENKKTALRKKLLKLNTSERIKLNNIEVGMDLTIGSSFRNLSSSSPEGENINAWRKIEKPKAGYSIELIGMRYFRSGLTAGLGLGILNVGEKGNQTFKQSDSRCGDRYDRDNDNDEEWIQSLTYTNSYTYFTIPFLTGYRYQSGRLTIAAQGGILPSFLVSTGQTLHYYNYYEYFAYSNLSSWRREDTAPPKEIDFKNFIIAYSFQASLIYTRTRLSYSLGPSYKHIVTSMYKSSAPIKQNSFLLGISGSIKYSF